MAIRSPIFTVVGHVDHGKTSILDKIRSTAIIETEAGKITQAIGASIIPLQTIRKICGHLLDLLKMELTIPGLLAIDTPGHAAFTNLRKRGGNLADIAILVVDINEGFKPQTEEAVEILMSYKTPFVIAANKIDLIPGWQTKDKNLLKNISMQNPEVIKKIETKLYELVGQLSEKFKLDSDRFDRVDDFTKKIAIVPTSAKTVEGIPELLMVFTGLAQKYLEQNLKFNVEGAAKGTILEVKEEAGLGTTLDVILYDGTLKVNDVIVIGGLDKPIITKVRSLLQPKPLTEMRVKSKFNNVKEVAAATGVKIAAPELKEAVSGMPLRSCGKEEVNKVSKEIQKEVEEVLVKTDKEGIVVKADSLGSLEAITTLLRKEGVEVKKASIGNVTKKDLSEAESNYEKDPVKSVVLGFNVKNPLAEPENVKVILSDVIYTLIDEFDKWKKEMLKKQEAQELEALTLPCKLEIMKGYVFRQSNPAIVGVNVLLGTLKTGIKLMKKDGKEITGVKAIQHEKENISKAEAGKQVAVSLDKVAVGRQINEGDVLYSAIPEEDFRKLKELKRYLTPQQKDLLKEIAEIKRKDNAVWGI